MITKTVTSGQRSATATISEETKFVFSDKWNFFHVQNLGTGTVYIGMSVGVTAGNDGVIAIPSGGTACTMHNFPADSVYILSTASDLVQVVGSNSAFPPFKQGGSGGGGSTYILPKATAVTLGGIQAKAKTTENAEAAIGTDNKLYVAVPLALSELSNDENFIKNTVDNLVNYYTKSDTYTKTEINTIVGNLNVLTTTIVTALPTENISTSTIYLIQTEGTSNYVQWMYINSAWANLGSTEINLTNYYTKLETYSKTETDNLLLNKVDKVDGKGLSANDFTTVLKDKLDGIADGANNYTLPAATTSTLGGVKVDGTSVTIADGVISAPGGGGGVTVDDALSDTSTNPVQNKVVNAALADKSGIDHTQAADKGGTGQTSYTVGDILYADSATTLAKLEAGAADTVLTSNGAEAAPSWEVPSGGGGITQTLLYSGMLSGNQTYLSGSYTNYKMLVISVTLSATEKNTAIVNCADIVPDANYGQTFYYVTCSSSAAQVNGIKFANSTTFQMTAVVGLSVKIYGVN